jgi:hypothetical protein
MRSKDIVQLFNMVGSGAKVIVDTEHLPQPMLGPQIQQIAQSSY